MKEEQLFFCYLAGVPLLGIGAQWLAWRLRFPSILLLLAFGIALGRWLDPDDLIVKLTDAKGDDGAAKLLFPLVSLSVAVILFEGGLSLQIRELREAGRSVFRLALTDQLLSD